MTDTVTLLRLQDADGDGAFAIADMQDYTSAAVAAGLMTPEEDEWEHYHTAERGFPGLHNDEELQWAIQEHGLSDTRLRYAFPSDEIARQWFPPCMADALKQNGLTLTVWEVPEDRVAISDRQAVFDPDAATLVQTLPVDALWDDALLHRQLPLPLAA